VILEPGSPYDFTDAELVEIADAMREYDPDASVDLARRDERGYGVTPAEVLHVFLDHEAEIVSSVTALQALYAAVKRRLKKDGRARTVFLYGPDGKPLEKVDIADPDGAPIEVEADVPPRARPHSQ
jgi:hypothetical protein